LIKAEAQTLERLAGRLGDGDAALAVGRGLMLLAIGEVSAALPLLTRAEDLVESFGELRWAASTYTDVAIYHVGLEGLFALGRFADARRRSRRRHEQLQTTDALLLPSCEGAYVARMDFETGHWASAVATFGEILATCRRTGMVRFVWQASAVLAEIAAAHGQEEDCSRLAAEARELAGEGWAAGFLAGGAEGLLELGRGRYGEAAASYAPLLSSLGSLTLWPQVADALEAFVRAGLGADVEALLERFAKQAHASGIPWACARAEHLRGVTAPEGAFPSCFEQALHWHTQAAQPFPQARTHLAYGERLRRQGRRADARAHLRTALETFEALAAAPWAERGARELRATGERVPRRRPARDPNLTSQELQVALAVARGATNRQAAAQLFLSPKTIEKHLGSVYAKLGVGSRRELARVFALERETPELVGVSTPLPVEQRASTSAGAGV
jgi:DNA-binding CsgD family transcriptional regulator